MNEPLNWTTVLLNKYLGGIATKVLAVFHAVSYTHLDVYKRQWQG